MPKDKALVTVIIPVYSRPDLLIQTLRSVYAQTYHFGIKIIVVDDHSQQNIKTIISKIYPSIKIIRNRINLKSGPARNQALKYINTPFVAFLDADDIWNPNFLQTSIYTLEKYKSAASLAMSKPLISSGLTTGFIFKILVLSLIRDIFILFFYFTNHKCMPQSAFYLCQLSHVVFNTRYIKNLRFDEAYNNGGEDWKFILQVMDKGFVSIIPKRLVYYRYHPKSSTFIPLHLFRKWSSYQQLFSELDRRGIKGLMVWLFNKYIRTFKPKNSPLNLEP